MRATEKGYRVGVMEAGKRWNDEDIPKTSWDIRKFAWQPEAEMYGIQRMERLDPAGVDGEGDAVTSPAKVFEVTGMDDAVLQQRLSTLLGEA